MKKEIKSLEREIYISPDIELMDIEIEQNVLLGGSPTTSGESDDKESLDLPYDKW